MFEIFKKKKDEKTGLTKKELKAIKKLIMNINKFTEKLSEQYEKKKENIKDYVELNEKVVKTIFSLDGLIDIVDEKGEKLTKEDLLEDNVEENLELLKEIVDELYRYFEIEK